MNLNSIKTVRELAVEIPQATRVLERLKIDYCCGGNTALTDACAKAGVELAQLEQMLGESDTINANRAVDFQNRSLGELIAHILDKHHVYTKTEMNRLQALLEKVIGVHGANHSELGNVQKLFRQLSADLEPHMFKEEQILFPYIIELENSHTQKRTPPFAPFGTVNTPVRMMMMEHETAGELLRELRTVTKDYCAPEDACISYQTLYSALADFESDLHQHIHLENNILFPRAIAMEELLNCG